MSNTNSSLALKRRVFLEVIYNDAVKLLTIAEVVKRGKE